MSFTLSQLNDALAKGAAIRSISRLLPAGGEADKVFPPTYAVDSGSRYVHETRRIGEEEVACVLLDSVASQANRHESALLNALYDDELPLPCIGIDFREEEGLSDMGLLTYYETPHRVADALLRDGLLDGVPFRASDVGRSFTDSTPRNATALYRIDPHALVFGVWDSTGPKGGMGSKFARCLTSEIVAFHAKPGSRTASRLDPAQIGRSTPVYEGLDGEWTIDPKQAKLDKKKEPIRYKKEGKPSQINHGNVAPSIEENAGGVSLSHAQQTWVLSLAGLRRLQFPEDCSGTSLTGPARSKAQKAARVALAAIALVAASHARRDGFDLRSRCVLVPDGPLEFEVLDAEGGESTCFTLTASEASQLLRDAHEEAKSIGMGWNTDPIHLQPMPKLADLIRRSRELAANDDVAE